MPELRPDDQQLRLQGQVNQLTSPPPMPQVNTFVPNAETTNRGRLGAFTNQLGDVLANQALERQRLVNQGMISNALISAQSAMDDLYSQQIQRKGFNVMAKPATDTEDAQDDIMDIFSRGMSEITSSIDSKFTNDFQREQFYRSFAPIVLNKTDSLNTYYNNEIRTATLNSQEASVRLLANDAVGYMQDGQLDKAGVSLYGAEQAMKTINDINGGNQYTLNNMVTQFYNNTIPPLIAQLNQEERYSDMVNIYKRFGQRLTGQARVVVSNAVGTGSVIAQAGDNAKADFQAHLNDAQMFNPDGTINEAYTAQIKRNQTRKVGYIDYTTTTYGGAVQGDSGNSYINAVTAGIRGGEKSTSITERNDETGAYGLYQIIPSTRRAYAKLMGITEEYAKTAEGQEQMKNYMLKDAIENQGMDTPEKLFVWWLSGDPQLAESFAADPENPRWKTLDRRNGSDGNISLYDYVQRSMVEFNKYTTEHSGQGAQSNPAPTYNIPIASNIWDANLSSTNAGLKATLPYVGGIITAINPDTTGLIVSGGARTKEQNQSLIDQGIQAGENSYHLYGDAVDIVLSDSTTPEQAESILAQIKATGMFNEVRWHDAGQGYHLHVAGYNGSLNTWLKNSGFGTGVTTQTERHMVEVRSGQYEQAYSSEFDAQVREYNRQVMQETNQIIQDLSKIDWTSNNVGLQQNLRGRTIMGKPLTQVQIANIMGAVNQFNAGTVVRHDADVHFADYQRQRSMRRQEQADRQQSAIDMYWTDRLNGGVTSYDQLASKPYWANIPPQMKVNIKEAYDKGYQDIQDNVLQQAKQQIEFRLRSQFGQVDPYVVQSSMMYVSDMLKEHYRKYGKAPASPIVRQWVEHSISPAPNTQSNWRGSKIADTVGTAYNWQQGTSTTGYGAIDSNGNHVWIDSQGNQTKMTWDEKNIGGYYVEGDR